MAFWFKPGGPQVSAARAPAPLAGQMTLAVASRGPAAAIAMFPDHGGLPRSRETIATSDSVIPNPGRAQLDCGRLSV
jgi:hypothetical protein